MRSLEPVSSPNLPASPVVVTTSSPAAGAKPNARIPWEEAAAVGAPEAPVASQTATLGPLIRLGGWSGWHRGMWEPQLKDAAVTAGVVLKLEVVEQHWWRGTTYRIVITGPKDGIERYARWYQRQLDTVDRQTST